MIDYSIPIPKDYWSACKQQGQLVDSEYNGKKLCIYVPFGYDAKNRYDVFYFKMGTNNTARQFWTYPGYTSNFNYVIDNLIARGEIKPCIICSIQGNPPGGSWLPENAYGLICHVEGLYHSYADIDPKKIIESAPHRAVGGWSLGSIECRTMLVNDRKNDFYKGFGWWDIQSGYNANGMNTIDPNRFVGCAAGTNDDGGCVKFTKACQQIFAQNKQLSKNKAQIVSGYTHMIKFQLNYFYNAIKYFFGNN